MGLKQEGRENLLPYASLVFNAFGPPNQLRQEAIERSAPHQSYVAAQCQRENLAPGGFGPASTPGPMPAKSPMRRPRCWCVRCFRPDRHDRQRHRRRGLLPGALSRPVGEAAERSDACVQCIRGGRPLREPGADLLPHHDARGRDRRTHHRRRREGADVPRRRQSRSAPLGEPDSYDITRRTSGHVGYGSGIHMCVGQLVARLEGEVMMAALRARSDRSRSPDRVKRLSTTRCAGSRAYRSRSNRPDHSAEVPAYQKNPNQQIFEGKKR